MEEQLHWIEREILEAFYQTAIAFRSGAIDENALKERVLQAARRHERALSPEMEHAGAKGFAWKI